jgi:hypothetical protein
MKLKLISLSLFCAISVTAQTFTHSLTLEAKKSAMQALAITPELKNLASTSFNDVRIFDKNQNEVPYFTVNESFNYPSVNFKEYEISDKEVGKGRYTSFIVNNPEKEPMQNVVLCIANSDAWKLCDVVGSDDKKQWYSVSDGIPMYRLYDEGTVHAYRTLSFPMVNYKYIKVEINDLSTLPLNILKVGYFEGAISAGKLNKVTPETMTYGSDKEKKISQAKFKFSNATIINRVNFRIKAPNYYKRQARIIADRVRYVKNKEEHYKDVLLEFELNSNTNNSFELHGFRESEFEIEISNEDNPPLEPEGFEFLQLQTYLVADFKAGEQYTLMVGNKKLNAPSYDIEYFRNKISQFVPTLNVSELKAIPQPEPIKIITEEKKMWQEPWFMWLCIALASFMLFLFSVRILKDMKK